MSLPLSVQAMLNLKDLYKQNPQKAIETGRVFTEMRDDPTSEFYAPYASGKSNYTEMTSLFGVDRFDDDFFRKNAGLTQYLRYGADGTPLAPTKKSKPEEIAAYQFYRVQKADEPTRQLEDQWRALQKELSDKVSFGMDDDAIVQSIDWSKYGALKDYEQNVKIRNTPMLTRPVSFSEDSVYGVLAAVRKGDKVGQTDRDYLPELTDYYDKAAQAQKNVQPNANQKGLPGYVAPASASGSAEAPTVSTASTVENQPVSAGTQLPTAPISGAAAAPNNQVGNPDSNAAKTESELDTIYTQQEKDRQDKIDFSNLQYKMFTGLPLTDDEKKRWTELYPTQGHGKPGASIPAGLRLSSSGGGSPLTVEQQNNDWMNKYTGFAKELYGESLAGNQSAIKQLSDLRYAADTLGMTVEQYLTDVVGDRPQWLNDLDYNQRLKDNPESITRLRPIEEVLSDYRAGNELSEAEREMIWMYDTKHPNLMGGKVRGNASYMFPAVDSRTSLGKIAYAALSASDSANMTPEESNALILSIGADMDASFGRYSTLEDYYSANPERAAELQVFVDEEKARTEEAAVVKAAQDTENAKQAQQYAMSTLSAYAKGNALDANQQQFITEIKAMPVTDADYSDSAYMQAEKSLMDLSFEDLVSRDKTYAQYTDTTVSMMFKRTALDALDMDIRIAKSAGLTLSQMYEMFPEMCKDPYEMMSYARKAVEQKWATDDPASIFGWLFGMNEKDLTGKGVGAGTALVKGTESGGLQFAQGYMGFARNYLTETDESTVQAWNRQRYGGPMGRAKAKNDFTRAIEGITDPERKSYWQNYMAGVKDIYDLPFNFSDESVLNGLYENKKALKQIENFMLSNGTPAEYAAFMVSSSLVDNTLSMATTAAATVATGNPFIGTMVGFGPATAYQASETARAAGLSQPARNTIGLVAAGITSLTEAIPFEKYMSTGTFLRGSANLLKAEAMQGGASFAKKLSSKIIVGATTLGSRMIENSAVEMTQETFENILNDTWLNLTGAQNKSAGDILNDATRAGAMAMITSPFLTGEAYFMTTRGKAKITDGMREQAQKFVESKTAEAMQNPDTVGKVIEAQAAADTVETLANGGLADVDTSVVEQTTQDLQKAETDLQTAKDAHTAARMDYADQMQQYVENGTVMPDAEHNTLVQTLESAKKTYQAATKFFITLNEKLQQAQAVVGKQIASIVQTARAEAATKAQADILSEIAARNMAKADQVAEAQTVTANKLTETQKQGPIDIQEAATQDRLSFMKMAFDQADKNLADFNRENQSIRGMDEDDSRAILRERGRLIKERDRALRALNEAQREADTMGFSEGTQAATNEASAPGNAESNREEQKALWSKLYPDAQATVTTDQTDAQTSTKQAPEAPVTVDQASAQPDTLQPIQNAQPSEQAPMLDNPAALTPANVPPTNEGLYGAATGVSTQTDVQTQGQEIIPPTATTTETDVGGNTGKRQFANQTAQATEFLPDYIKNELLTNPEQSDYQRQQNTEQVTEGYRRFRTAGYEQTINDLLAKDRFDSYDTATALVMMAEAKNRNDFNSLMAVAGKYNQLGTTAGQEMQARKIFLKMTPVGAMSTAAADAQNSFDEAWNKQNQGWRDNVNKQAAETKAEVLRLPASETDGGKNKWGIELNKQQLALIDRYGLGKVNRPGIFYNRASLKQRMLEAILATPNVAAESNNGLSLVDRLEYMKAGLPVVTNADLDYIGLRMGEYMGAGQDAGGRDAAVAIARVQEAAANITPSTSMQKVKTYRMVAMLGNVTTTLRNIIGNVGQNLLNDVSQVIASGADWAISKGTGIRTVSAPTVKERIDGTRAFIQETENTFRDFLIDKVDTGGENKFEARGKRVFQAPILETAKNITAFALSLGDRPFYKRAFVQSLAEQMRLSGSTITTQEMIDQATSDAKYATLTEDNSAADGIKRLKQIKTFGIGKIVEFLIPFDLVPSNVVRRTIEYSPLGLADAVVHQGLWNGWKNHSFDQKAFVNGLARGLTGTGLFAVGMALHSIGAIKLGTGEDKDKDVSGVRASAGDQFSPYIEVFRQKVGLSFLTPSISAMVMGASAYEAMQDNEDAINALWSGVSSMGDQIFDASYLTALQDVFSGGGSVFENAVSTIPGNALSQFIPSVLRQVGNGLDPYVRDTNEKDLVMRAIKKGVWGNLPYLRELLPAKIDVSGKPVKSKGMLNSLLNPAYITEDVNDPALDEMLRLVDATGESTFLPTDNLYGARNTLTGGSRPLTDTEKEAYKVRKGTLLMDGGRTIDKSGAEVTMPGLRALMASDTYKRMSDQQKADSIKGQVDAANDAVNAEYLKIVGTATKEKSTDYAPKAATSVPVYFMDKNPWYMKQLNKLYDQTGDASYLPTTIGTTFERTVNKEKKEYSVPQGKTDAFYKLYDAELSNRLANLDWNLTGQELAEKVKSAISQAQEAAKNTWVKDGYWR